MSEISVTLPDGSSSSVPEGATARDVAAAISPRLAKAAIAAVVDGRPVDLNLPLTADARVEILTDRGAERRAGTRLDLQRNAAGSDPGRPEIVEVVINSIGSRARP